MTKAERLEYMRKRFPQLREDRVDAVLPISQEEINSEANELDTYREFTREKRVQGSLTSDE